MWPFTLKVDVELLVSTISQYTAAKSSGQVPEDFSVAILEIKNNYKNIEDAVRKSIKDPKNFPPFDTYRAIVRDTNHTSDELKSFEPIINVLTEFSKILSKK